MIKLPKIISIIKFANENVDYSGYVRILDLDRLANFLHKSQEDTNLYINVAANRDLQHRCILHLEIKGELVLICQRCLDKLSFTIDKKLDLIALNSIDNIANKEGSYEPILIDEDGKINFYDIISDEIILSIPQVPRHDDVKCTKVSDIIQFEEV